jgi:hypothetical protein
MGPMIAALVLATPRSATASIAGSTSVDLPLTGLTEMVVDDAHGHIFLTGYSAVVNASGTHDGVVAVANADGTMNTTLDVPGAAGMYLDPGSNTLYVAEGDANAIQPIDTSTLTLGAAIDTGTAAGCPMDISKIGGFLWTNIGCGTNAGGLAKIRLSDDAVTGYGSDAAGELLASSGTTLFTVGTHMSPTSQVDAYDVSSGTPSSAGSAGTGLTSPQDLDVSPDGTDLLVTSAYDLESFAVSDLSGDVVYDTTPYAVAGAVSPDSGWVVGGMSAGVSVYQTGTAAPLNTFALPDIAPRGVAMSADDTELFAVTGAGTLGDGHPVLWTIADPTVPRSSLALDAGAASFRLGTPIAISGTLSFTGTGSPSGAAVHIVRTNPDTSQTPLADATADAGGGFQLSDTPPQLGSYTYAATFDGTAGHRTATASVQLAVVKVPPHVTLSASHTSVDYGRPVTLDVHLGAYDTAQLVSIVATPKKGAKHLVKTAAVNGSGNLTVSFEPIGETTVTASTGGGASVQPGTSTSVVITVRPRLTGTMEGGYASQGRYRLYHYVPACQTNRGTGCPVSVFTLAPNHARRSLNVRVELFVHGHWNVAASFSPPLSAGSTVGVKWLYDGTVIGLNARVRARFAGDTDHLAVTSGWLYFKIVA